MAPPAPSLQDVIAQVQTDAAEDDPLGRLQVASGFVRDLAAVGDAALGHFVDQARRAGHSWSEIGDALGVSKQAAQQRHTQRLSFDPGTASFERFTPRARNVLAAADPIARAWGHGAVDTEHLFMALYHEPQGIAAVALDSLGLPADRAEAALRAKAPPGTGDAPEGKLNFTPEARSVLSGALTSALELGHNYIGTEHLLLGITRAGGVPSAVLAEAGLTTDALTDEITRRLAAFRPGTPPPTAPAERGARQKKPASAPKKSAG